MGELARAWICLLLGLASVWLLRVGWTVLRGTTLRAAWCWAVVAIAGIAGVEMLLALGQTDEATSAETLRFAAAVLAFCPTMAVLGGKRPQNTAWQFIVFTLWGILALPAFEIWLRGRGEVFSIDPVRSWFLVVLVLVGLGNYLPTRFGLAAALYAAGQVLLLWEQLPAGDVLDWRPPVWPAMALLVMSGWAVRRAAARGPHRGAHRDLVSQLGDWNLVWRDFRDWFGTVWSVRVMDRVNASAASDDWPVALGWEGFIWRGTTLPPDANPPQAAGDTLRALMRRFVSPEWIERRLGEADAGWHGTKADRADGTSSGR